MGDGLAKMKLGVLTALQLWAKGGGHTAKGTVGFCVRVTFFLVSLSCLMKALWLQALFLHVLSWAAWTRATWVLSERQAASGSGQEPAGTQAGRRREDRCPWSQASGTQCGQCCGHQQRGVLDPTAWFSALCPRLFLEVPSLWRPHVPIMWACLLALQALPACACHPQPWQEAVIISWLWSMSGRLRFLLRQGVS